MILIFAIHVLFGHFL